MRVCFLVQDPARSGGVRVISGHAERLAAGGEIEPEIVLTGEAGPGGLTPEGVPVRALAEASGEYDIAIATWWGTAPELYEVPARRRVVFLQSLEQRFYRPEELFERLAAALTLALPVDFLAVSSWIRDTLAELHPGARCRVVPNGVDKAVFAPRPQAGHEGRLRVLVEGQPGLWFKGVEDAVSAVLAMREPAELTLVALDAAEAETAGLAVDRVVGGLEPAEMAELYSATDVLVKLSRVEGLGLAPLEAFHLGVPCLVTPYGGHADYVLHGENGLVVGFDDLPGATRWLDLLAADRELLRRLSEGALATAGGWPGEPEATEVLASALKELASEPPPKAEGLRGVMRSLELSAHLGRQHLSRLAWEIAGLKGAVAWNEAALSDARALVEELSSSRDECAEMLEQQRLRLVEIESSRAHRAAEAMRKLRRREEQ